MAVRITTKAVPKPARIPNGCNIAPRIGFAYRLTSDAKTAIRGGAGYYYTPPQASIYNPFANIAPFAPTYSYNDVDFADPYGSVGIPNPFPAQYGPKTPGPEALFTVSTDLRATFPAGYHIPQLLEWNLMIEREFIRDWLARIGYFGNKGTHFYGNGSGPDRPANAAIYVPGIRPSPTYSSAVPTRISAMWGSWTPATIPITTRSNSASKSASGTASPS